MLCEVAYPLRENEQFSALKFQSADAFVARILLNTVGCQFVLQVFDLIPKKMFFNRS